MQLIRFQEYIYRPTTANLLGHGVVAFFTCIVCNWFLRLGSCSCSYTSIYTLNIGYIEPRCSKCRGIYDCISVKRLRIEEKWLGSAEEKNESSSKQKGLWGNRVHSVIKKWTNDAHLWRCLFFKQITNSDCARYLPRFQLLIDVALLLSYLDNTINNYFNSMPSSHQLLRSNGLNIIQTYIKTLSLQ